MMNESNLIAIYPPPPWYYTGDGIILFSFRIKEGSIPKGCTFSSILPMRTLAGYYIAQYHTPLIEDEKPPWHEWGNVSGLIKKHKTRGLYIDAMGTDSPSALHGGKNLWGLNKIQTSIQFQSNKGQGEASLEENDGIIHLYWKDYGPTIQRKQDISFLTSFRGEILKYIVTMKGDFCLGRVKIDQQTSNSFNTLHPGNYFGVHFINTSITVMPPMQIQ